MSIDPASGSPASGPPYQMMNIFQAIQFRVTELQQLSKTVKNKHRPKKQRRTARKRVSTYRTCRSRL